MNIFRIDLPADASTLALKRNKRTAERAQRDTLLNNQLVLENDLSGDLLERSKLPRSTGCQPVTECKSKASSPLLSTSLQWQLP